MRNRKHEQRLDAAIAWAEDARRDALRRVRASGNPRNPAQAQEGRDEEFHAGKKDAFGLELVLVELKARRRQDRTDEAARFVGRALRAVVDYALPFLGVVTVVTFLDALGAPSLITNAILLAGAIYVVARASSEHEARK